MKRKLYRFQRDGLTIDGTVKEICEKAYMDDCAIYKELNKKHITDVGYTVKFLRNVEVSMERTIELEKMLDAAIEYLADSDVVVNVADGAYRRLSKYEWLDYLKENLNES